MIDRIRRAKSTLLMIKTLKAIGIAISSLKLLIKESGSKGIAHKTQTTIKLARKILLNLFIFKFVSLKRISS